MKDKKPTFPVPTPPDRGPHVDGGRRIYSDIPTSPKRESIRVPTSDTTKPGTPGNKGGQK